MYQTTKRNLVDFFEQETRKEREVAYKLRYAGNKAKAFAALLDVCLETGQDRELTRVAVSSLAVIDSDGTMAAFRKLTVDRNPVVRCRGISLLAELGDSAAVNTVLQALGEKEINIVKTAIYAIGKLGGDRRAIEALLPIIDGCEPDFLKNMAKRSLKFVLLRISYEESKDYALHKDAIRLLVKLFPRDALDAFAKSAANKVPARRSKAYLNLGITGDRRALQTLRAGLLDRDEEVRRMAIIGVGKLGRDRESINALRPLLNNYESMRIQSAARRAIDTIQARINSNGGCKPPAPRPVRSANNDRTSVRLPNGQAYERRAF